MKRFNLIGVGVLTALALGAVGVSGASASNLVLKHEGKEAAGGSPAVAFVVIGGAPEECDGAWEGTLGKNDKSKDKASFKTSVFNACEESGYSLSGNVSAADMSSAGVASFKGALTYTTPKPCTYTIKKFSTTFDPSEEYVFGSGEASGKLAKGSSASCAKTLTVVTEVGPALFEPFETDI
ncbi:MAG TPA: hypothetical protein VMD79_03030 [Solirubrobacteraceae bacterium]|nr:hypothetical protein [Solirubrobacteraceae bacterium]